MNEKLDLSALQRTTVSLKVALDEWQRVPDNEFVRDSCMQRFEYCYDLAAKMIKRYLSQVAANPGEVQGMSFQTQIREAYTLGITQRR